MLHLPGTRFCGVQLAGKRVCRAGGAAIQFLGLLAPPSRLAASVVVPVPCCSCLGFTWGVCQNARVNLEATSIEPELQDRLRFESMLADLSSRFVNLEPAEVDREIEDAQRRVCECLDLDLSALWQLSPEEPGVLRMTHLYRPLGGPPIPDDFDAREYNPWTLGEVLAGRVVSLPSIDEAPAEAATDCETWRHFDIKSVFCFPLSSGGDSAFGAMSFHAVREERS